MELYEERLDKETNKILQKLYFMHSNDINMFCIILSYKINENDVRNLMKKVLKIHNKKYHTHRIYITSSYTIEHVEKSYIKKFTDFIRYGIINSKRKQYHFNVRRVPVGSSGPVIKKVSFQD